MTATFDDIARSTEVVLVTVTYGHRLMYLSQLLDRTIGDAGVIRAVVVSNAAVADFSPLKAKWGNRIGIVELDSNTGSANGYAVGIQCALASGAEYLWLMDDDNAPAKGALLLLRQELSRLSTEVGVDRAAVSGFRASRMKALGDVRRNFAPPSSFVGFHTSQIPQKLSRLLGRQTPVRPVAGHAIDVPYAPYGGFLAHCQAFRRLGVPKKDLVLYADDWEYTMRLTKSGGRIRLVFGAIIDELEASWNRERKQANVFLQSLVSGTDLQVYYTFRNHVWLSRNVQCASQLIYRLNKFTFLALLSVLAISLRKRRRLGLIRRAVSDGERGRLGVNASYPLA